MRISSRIPLDLDQDRRDTDKDKGSGMGKDSMGKDSMDKGKDKDMVERDPDGPRVISILLYRPSLPRRVGVTIEPPRRARRLVERHRLCLVRRTPLLWRLTLLNWVVRPLLLRLERWARVEMGTTRRPSQRRSTSIRCRINTTARFRVKVKVSVWVGSGRKRRLRGA